MKFPVLAFLSALAITTCDATLCLVDQFVSSNVCEDCPAGTTNEADNDASNIDTTCDDVDGCTLDTKGGCNGDSKATCSLSLSLSLSGYVNSRTCTCEDGYSGTSTLADDDTFGGCTDYDGCSVKGCNDVGVCTEDTKGGCNGDSKATCSDGGVNSRTCTCEAGYSGTSSTLADGALFGGCTATDGCTLYTNGCNGDQKATCSLGDGINSRTCTCDAGYSGTDAGLTDAASFGGCTDIDGCTLDTNGCNGDSKATCSLGDGANSRTCTCDAGYSGTSSTLADDASFSGCAVIGVPPTPKNLSCGLAQPSVEQYENGPPLCLIINYDGVDKNFTVFYPKVDDFTLLIVADSFDLAFLDDYNEADKSVFVRLEVGTVTSPYRRRNKGSLVVPFFTAIVEVDDGEPKGITWDDGCFACESSSCLDDQTCAIKKADCGGENECDFKFYTGWFGTDKNGRYLTSAGKRLSRFKGGSVRDVYESAKTIVIDTTDDI